MRKETVIMPSRGLIVGLWVASFMLLCCAGCGGDSGKGAAKGKGSAAERIAKAAKIEDPEQRARELLKIAKDQKAASDLGAESTLKSASDAAEQVEDAKSRASVLISV